MSEPKLLQVRGLAKHYAVGRTLLGRPRRLLRALDGVDFSIAQGETLGLVGESGCGKTTLGRCLLRLEEPTAGEVTFEGEDVRSASRGRLRSLRRNLQMIFQDPYASLNPRKTVGRAITDGLAIHRLMPARERSDRVARLLDQVGLHAEQASLYPHEFSGGQRQRIGIARAIALEPKLVVADEAVSSLDVSIQAQIINLLLDLQDRMKLAYLFISHDLGVVRQVSDRIAVMYLGRIVEIGPRDALLSAPAHPYTAALLAAAPRLDPGRRRPVVPVTGDALSLLAPPPGCPFHPRCPRREARCAVERPEVSPLGEGHSVACFSPIPNAGLVKLTSERARLE